MRKGVAEEGVLVREDSKITLVELGTRQTFLAPLLNSCVMSDKYVISVGRTFLSIKWRLRYLLCRAALEITGDGTSSAQESYYYYHDLD